MLVLGIVGRANAGKSTVSKAILKEATIKGLTAEVFELSSYVLKEATGLSILPSKSRSELTPSEIEELVKLGTQRREENPTHWIELLLQDIETKKPDVAICPSIRFLNEAVAIRELRGKIIRTTTYNQNGSEWIARDRDPNDTSETEQYQINADYLLATLRGQTELLKIQSRTLFQYIVEYGTSNC